MADTFLLPDEESRLQQGARQAPVDSAPMTFLLPGEQSAAERAAGTLRPVLSVKPDDVARNRALAASTGLPEATVSRDPGRAGIEDRMLQLRAIMATSPILARQMADPSFAALAHDDAERLAKVERSLADPAVMTPAEFTKEIEATLRRNPALTADDARFMVAQRYKVVNDVLGPQKPIPATIENIFAGLAHTTRNALGPTVQGLRQQVADLFGFSTVSNDAAKKAARLQFEQSLVTPNFETSTGRGLYSGGVSLIQQAPGWAASILTGNPLPGLAAAGLTSEAAAYTKYKARGAGGGMAALGAFGEGIVEIGTELLPMSFLVSRFGKAGMGEFLTGLLAREVPGEQIATFLQDAIDTAVANPGKTWTDFMQERTGPQYETLIATIVQAGAMGAVNEVGYRMMGGEIAARNAEEQTKKLEEILKAVAGSATTGRSLDAVQSFVQLVADEGGPNGGPIKEVFIPAAMFAQAAGEKLEELKNSMPSVKAQIDEALIRDSDLVIPIGEFATRIQGTGLEQSLLDHVRTSPDAMTRAEAKTFMQGQVEEFKQEAARIIDKKVADSAFVLAAKAVEADITQQLATVNRFTPEVNKAYASILSAFYTTTAERLGITPAEMYAKYPIRFAAERVAGDSVLNQSDPTWLAKYWSNYRWGSEAEAREHIKRRLNDQNEQYAGLFAPTNLAIVDQLKFKKAKGGKVQVVAPTQAKPRVQWSGEEPDADLPAVDWHARDMADDGTEASVMKEYGRGKGRVYAAWIPVSELPKARGEDITDGYLDEHSGARDDFSFRGEPPPMKVRIGPRGKVDIMDGNHRLAWWTEQGYSYVPAYVIDERAEYGQPPEGWGTADTSTPGSPDPLKPGVGSRGTISFAPDITTSPSVISLLKNADLSTFLHEAGHFMLEVLTHVASQPNAPAAITADMNAVLAWFGIKGEKGYNPKGEHSGQQRARAAGQAGSDAGSDSQRAAEAGIRSGPRPLAYTVRKGNGGQSRVVASYAPDPDIARELNALGVSTPEFHEVADAAAFHAAISAVAQSSPFGAAVFVYPLDDYAGMRLFLADGGKAGFALKGDDIVSVFNGDPQNLTKLVRAMLPLAVQQGGRRLDAFDTVLPGLYSVNGFRAVARLKWDDSQAPAGWDKQRFAAFNNGEPDVVFMAYDPAATAYQPSDGPVVPDYDAAVAAQSAAVGAGRTALDVWRAMSIEQKRPYHERFARGFEAYLFEGTAPNVEMRGLFARFRAWLVNVYKSLTALKVELSDEVRGVMNRLIASDAQIEAAENARNYAPLFKTAEEMGATPEEWAAYQMQASEATREAVEQLQSRSLRDMRWLTNARGRKLKQMQADAKAKRAAVEKEVAAEVRAIPLYAAMRFLRYGELSPAALFAPGTTLAGKLDLQALKEMYGEGPAAPWRYLQVGKNGLAAAEGLHPDVVAELFGFTSGDELVRKMLEAEPEDSVIEGMTDQRMLERYGDISSADALGRAVDDALHNEARARFIATELRALAKATGKRNVLAKAAKAFAEEVIARKKIRDVKPAYYTAAEARAAKAAERAKGLVEKATEKRNQLVNHYAARAAETAVDDIEKGLAYFKRLDGNKAIDIGYREQIDAMLERFDLRSGQSLKAIDKRTALAEWIKAQEELGFEPTITDELRNEANRKHYKDMTVEEFRGLVDAVKNIEHLGRLKKKLLTLADQREFEALVDELRESIEENARGTVEQRRVSERGLLVEAGRIFRGFMADHRKFASLAREMDGWQDAGKMWTYLVRAMNKAGDAEAVAREQATIKLAKLFEPITKGLHKKQYFALSGKSFTLEERLAIALNMGNEVNRERVLNGEGLTPAALAEILDTLERPHWDFVQGAWDYLESFRPQIAAKERRLTGTEPDWVKPEPVITKFGEYKGGYYPIKYDPERSSRSEADSAVEVQRQLERGLYTRAQTRRGHLKERAESTGRPLRYDLSVIVSHVDQVIHDLSWHEFLIDANRVLRALDAPMREHYGVEKVRTMKSTLTDIAVGDLAAQTGGDRIFNYLRHGATIAGLGWRVTTSLLQPLGLIQSMARIGTKWVLKGAMHWAGDALHLTNSVRLVSEKSDFMRLRAKTLQREINEIRNKVAGKDSKLEASYFYLIQKMQLVADVPTWWGAYEKAMSGQAASEEQAIALADQAVRDAQGAGQIGDLSRVQRGSAGWKLFTNFYSFFNTTYNLNIEAFKRTRTAADVPLLAVDLVLINIVPAVLGTLLKTALAGDWDDPDKVARKLAADQIGYLLGQVMLVRETGAAAQALFGLYSDYPGPASMRLFADLTKLGQQAAQGDLDEGFWKALNSTAGDVFHYPAGQINATIDGILALANGETANPGALLVGHK